MALTIAEILHDLVIVEMEGCVPPRVLFTATIGSDVDATDESGRTPLFFIPDLHVLSPQAGDRYDDYFNLNGAEEERLTALLRAMARLRDRENDDRYRQLLVYQLGDFHDLWREKQSSAWDTVRVMLQRQLDAHEELFQALHELDVVRLVGNHDDALRHRKTLEELEGEPIDALFPVESIHPGSLSVPWGPYQRLLLMHADQLDPVENRFYSHAVNPFVARRAAFIRRLAPSLVDEWEHEVYGAGWQDNASPTEQLEENVVYDARADDHRQAHRQKFYAEAYDYDMRERTAGGQMSGMPLAAAVIGHTHAPRIVTGSRDWQYKLVDCGSWVNVTTDANGNARFWNAQIGVLTGREIAVVQIGTR